MGPFLPFWEGSPAPSSVSNFSAAIVFALPRGEMQFGDHVSFFHPDLPLKAWWRLRRGAAVRSRKSLGGSVEQPHLLHHNRAFGGRGHARRRGRHLCSGAEETRPAGLQVRTVCGVQGEAGAQWVGGEGPVSAGAGRKGCMCVWGAWKMVGKGSARFCLTPNGDCSGQESSIPGIKDPPASLHMDPNLPGHTPQRRLCLSFLSCFFRSCRGGSLRGPCGTP